MSGHIITAQLIGDDTAQAGDIIVKSRTPIFALCRKLLANGADPDSPIECYRGSVMCIRVTSIGIGAELTVKERDRGGLEITRWQAFPSSPVEPRIRQNSAPGSKTRHSDEWLIA